MVWGMAGTLPSFSLEKVRAAQLRLSKRVIREDCLAENIQQVAGVDSAYAGEDAIGAAVVLDFSTLSATEFAVACVRTRFPYVPTMLSLREISPTVCAIRKLRVKPDVFLVDGHGIAHPYRFGFASHLGIVLNSPTIGVAKSLLCGEVQPLNGGGLALIVDRGETIGMAVTTVLGRKPVYVSIGHKVSLEKAVQIVMRCVKDHRIPEPIRRAHIIANAEKKTRGTYNVGV